MVRGVRKTASHAGFEDGGKPRKPSRVRPLGAGEEADSPRSLQKRPALANLDPSPERPTAHSRGPRGPGSPSS